MIELPPEVKQLVSLRPNESIINSWSGASDWYETSPKYKKEFLILTNFRVIIFEEEGEIAKKGFLSKSSWMSKGFRSVFDRDLRAIPPPRLEDEEFVTIGGKQFYPDDGALVAQGIIDEITFARNRVIPPDAQPLPSQNSKDQVVVKEVIKEVIKVRCNYCGALNLESDAKCSSCGASLGRR